MSTEATRTNSTIKKLFADSEIGKKGIEELETVIAATADSRFTGDDSRLAFDHTLARGLNYYTRDYF